MLACPESPPRRPTRQIDPALLAEFQAGLRKRYSDPQILAELTASAAPARPLADDAGVRRRSADDSSSADRDRAFRLWNAAKREAGLVPRRFATRAELVRSLEQLGAELGRPPTARDLDARKGSVPSKSLYWHTFGSLTNALREAGFDVPVGEERIERAVEQGMTLARRLGRLPKFADWADARRNDDALFTEWQVYRMFDAKRGAWATFQYLVRERLLAEGMHVAPDGAVVA